MCVSVAVAVAAGADIEFYVATTGSDSNDGTLSAPFLTLSNAQLAVRAALPTATEPIHVWVHGGTYHLSQPLEFTPADSGSASVPVTYAGYSNETAVLSGAIPLSTTWSTYSENIQVADIGAGLAFDVLFVNDTQQVLARYPNYDATIDILNGYAADAISSTRAAGWANPETGLVRALHDREWGGNSYRITGVDGVGNPTLQWVGDNNRGSLMHSTCRMVENIFEELDAPGEWFYDSATGNLYFYPLSGLNPSTAAFEAASTEDLIRIVGTGGSKVKHLTFDNFTFAKTHRTLFTRTYERPLRSDWGIARAGAVFIQDAEDVTISNSVFDRIGGNGIFMSGYNRNHLVTQNEFLENGATCVNMVGLVSAVRYPSSWDTIHHTDIQDTTPGPLTDDYPKDITVSYNHMQDMGRFEKQTCGVNISMSESITVSHNTVHGSPRAGINICDGTWGGHLIEFNDVFDCVRETSDHGPFNAWGRDRFWSYLGYNTRGSNGTQKKPYAFLDAWKTTVIRNNRFHYSEPRIFGIDLDDGSSNYELYNNLCLNCGIKLREGFGRKVYNNIMINGPADLHVWYDGCEDAFTNNIVVNHSAYSLAGLDASNMAAKQATIDSNLFYNAGDPVSIGFDGWSALGLDVNSVTANPLFTDPDTMNYTVLPGSPAPLLGFANFAMDQFGKPGAPEPDPVDFVAEPDPLDDSEPLMGAEAASIYNVSIQSALGAPDLNGIYFELVPAGSYAAGQGFETLDLIRAVDGVPITTKQSFWLIYNSIAPGTIVPVTLLRNQIEQPFSFVKPGGSEQLNDTAGVVYTGTWAAQVNVECFNNDFQFTQVAEDSFELVFHGTGISFTSQKNSDMGQVEVYIDGVLDETINCYNESRLYRQTVYNRTGLTPGIHTIKAVNAESKYMILDSITVSPGTATEVSTSKGNTAPVVSTTDLAQTQFFGSSATGGNDVASRHAELFNGLIGNEDGDTADVGEVTMDSGNSVSVELDTSVNTSGYDITGIDVYFGWNTAAGGRANQGYSIIVTYVDDSTAVLTGPEHWEPNSPASYWTTVSFTNSGAMASGVKAITFNIANDANPGGVVVGREIDVFGVPTIPTAHTPVILPGTEIIGGKVSLQFSGTPGQHYFVDYTETLTDPFSWQVLTNIYELATSPFSISTPATNDTAFYRIRWFL